MSESLFSHSDIPRDFWREVPCGHPPNPVAALTSEDHWICHCGQILDDVRTHVVIDAHDIKPCFRCGCYVGVPIEDAIIHGERRLDA